MMRAATSAAAASFYVCLTFGSASVSYVPDPVVITTSSGRLQGRVVAGLHGSDVEEYLSIPFASPPTGKNRHVY